MPRLIINNHMSIVSIADFSHRIAVFYACFAAIVRVMTDGRLETITFLQYYDTLLYHEK